MSQLGSQCLVGDDGVNNWPGEESGPREEVSFWCGCALTEIGPSVVAHGLRLDIT